MTILDRPVLRIGLQSVCGDFDAFCYKDFEAVDLSCSLGRGALDMVSASHMVLPFLYTMVNVYH